MEVATNFLDAAFLRGLALVIVLMVRLHLYRLATRRL